MSLSASKMALGYAKNIIIELAWVIQADEIEELPEQILAVVRVGHIELSGAKDITAPSCK